MWCGRVLWASEFLGGGIEVVGSADKGGETRPGHWM